MSTNELEIRQPSEIDGEERHMSTPLMSKKKQEKILQYLITLAQETRPDVAPPLQEVLHVVQQSAEPISEEVLRSLGVDFSAIQLLLSQVDSGKSVTLEDIFPPTSSPITAEVDDLRNPSY